LFLIHYQKISQLFENWNEFLKPEPADSEKPKRVSNDFIKEKSRPDTTQLQNSFPNYYEPFIHNTGE